MAEEFRTSFHDRFSQDDLTVADPAGTAAVDAAIATGLAGAKDAGDDLAQALGDQGLADAFEAIGQEAASDRLAAHGPGYGEEAAAWRDLGNQLDCTDSHNVHTAMDFMEKSNDPAASAASFADGAMQTEYQRLDLIQAAGAYQPESAAGGLAALSGAAA